jgi:hypothetical protein
VLDSLAQLGSGLLLHSSGPKMEIGNAHIEVLTSSTLK